MITITRNEARQLRAVLRRCGIKPLRHVNQRVQLSASSDGLRVRTAATDVAVEYHVPGELPAEELSLPLEFLDACDGRREDPVTLEGQPKDRVLVSWTDEGVPQQVQYDGRAPGRTTPFPDMPQPFTDVNPGLWTALGQAKETTDPGSLRLALGHIQLRGDQGQVIATDGHQALIQGGFQFPWPSDVLIPAPAVFGWSELAQDEPIGLGKTDDHRALRLGRWTILLRIEKEGKYPNVSEILPDAESIKSRLILTADDAQFLAQVLPRLPRDDEHHESITLDLGSQITVRAKPAGEGRATEVVLSNSQLAGEPVLINADRRFLARALKFGFREIGVKDLAAPLVCSEESQHYAWMPLGSEDAVKPPEVTIRIASPLPGAETIPTPKTQKRSRVSMTDNSTANKVSGAPADVPTTAQSSDAASAAAASAASVAAKNRSPRIAGRNSGQQTAASPIEQAVALKLSLRQTLSQTSELIRALKRQKKQSQLVASTLKSLKDLQQAG